MSTDLKGKASYMALKLDMGEAYDRLEWNFLEVMRKMGFDRRWINLVMNYIDYVSYSILINGDSHGKLFRQRPTTRAPDFTLFIYYMC